jgi:hypothetical protein
MGIQIHERPASANLLFEAVIVGEVFGPVPGRTGHSAGVGLRIDQVSTAVGKFNLD